MSGKPDYIAVIGKVLESTLIDSFGRTLGAVLEGHVLYCDECKDRLVAIVQHVGAERAAGKAKK